MAIISLYINCLIDYSNYQRFTKQLINLYSSSFIKYITTITEHTRIVAKAHMKVKKEKIKSKKEYRIQIRGYHLYSIYN